MSQDYNATLNLPKTDFPMRAGLPKSEPVTLQGWEDNKIYEKLIKQLTSNSNDVKIYLVLREMTNNLNHIK